MKNTILVLAHPNEPQLAVLEKLRAEANIITGNSVEAFGQAAPDATVIFNWSGSLELLRATFGMCPTVRWVHSRSAGLERTLFPELVERPVPLTNGSGVFSPSLAEFVLAAILFFAKDFRRMVRNQMAGVWEAFDVMPALGQTVGNRGIRRYRPRGRCQRAAAGNDSPRGETACFAFTRRGPAG